MDLEMTEIIKVFFEESTEGLAVMEAGLLELRSKTDREAINTIFRAAHSIKGGAGTFGFMEISHFTHAVETLLDQMRNGTRPVTADVLQELLQAVDVMREMLDLAQADKPIRSEAADEITRRLSALLAAEPPAREDPAARAGTDAPAHAGAEPGAVAADPGADDHAGWRIDFRPHASLFETCNDPLRIFRQLATLGTLHVSADARALPSLAELDPTQCHLRWTLTLPEPVPQAELAEVFDWVDANSSIAYERLSSAEAPDPAQAAGPPAAQLTAQLTATPPATPAAMPDASPAAPSASKTGADAASIRVATQKIDALINLVGELVITQSMLSQFSGLSAKEDIEALRRGLMHLARNTRELQESVLKIRMLPISFSFNRFPRLVHDLSRKLGKKVELRLSGETTELDKVVLEKIGDPLVHLVRNALDHGLEAPAARAAAGKAETGILELNAYHEGGHIIVEVKDDGAGLDKARILQKARDRGLIAPDATLGDEQIFNLIFLPGFSTAAVVSDVSGRGVGMDVVRRNIGDLGGTVQVSSVPGRGSTIRIRLPLTLAILEGQMLRVGAETYVISLASMIETVQPRRELVHSIAGRSEMFKHRDALLPIIRLHELFGVEPDSRDVDRGLLLIAEADGRRVAILVDELLLQQQVVIKSLETNFKQVPGVAGATICGDGTVALILDVPGLIAKFLGNDARPVVLAA